MTHTTEELERLIAEAGIKPGTLFAEHGSILIDDRYLYDVGHGEVEQGGDLHEVASMLPIMAELFVAAVNALPELLAKVKRYESALRIADRAIDAVLEFDGHPQYCGEKVDEAYYAIRAALSQEAGS